MDEKREAEGEKEGCYTPTRCFELENPCNYDNSAFRHPRTPEKEIGDAHGLH